MSSTAFYIAFVRVDGRWSAAFNGIRFSTAPEAVERLRAYYSELQDRDLRAERVCPGDYKCPACHGEGGRKGFRLPWIVCTACGGTGWR